MAKFNNTDMNILHSYITAHDSTSFSGLAQGTVSIDCTHSNLLQRHIELRFDKHEKVEELKFRIYRQTGTPPQYQKLIIKQGGVQIGEIGPDTQKMIGFYSIESGMEIHCIDLNPYSNSANGGYEDVSKIKKYKMSEEDYEKKKGTLREWAKIQKANDKDFTLEKHAKEHQMLHEAMRLYKSTNELKPGFEIVKGKVTMIKKEEVDENLPPPDESTVAHVVMGGRCSVFPGDRRGMIMYKGEIEELNGGGHWVGVKFDEPVGKTDGTLKGKVYFEAEGEGRGGFIRGKNVTCGDFPETDLMDESDEDSEDEL